MKPVDEQLKRLVAPVAGGIARMREVLLDQVRDASGAVSDMTDHVGRFRGKELRGALVLLAGEATGNVTDEHPSIAAIVELIHLATLVHDDVLDGARTRRRVASVNVRWDNQTAVLLGDFLYARAFALSTDLSSRLASRLLSETTRRICVGEIEQSTRRYDFELSETAYLDVSGAKTASLYAAACELGARYPGGRREIGATLCSFGWELGLAFQIVDDCLDVFGKEEVVGKPVGNDVADGKVTLPVLYAFRNADEATRARIRDVYTLPELEDRAARLREVVDLAPGVEYAMTKASDLATRARGRVADLPPSEARDGLTALCEYVLRRRW